MGRARPQVPTGLAASFGPHTATAPLLSDIPKTSNSGTSTDRRCNETSADNGATPVHKNWQQSKPHPFRTFRKAMPRKKVNGTARNKHRKISGASALHQARPTALAAVPINVRIGPNVCFTRFFLAAVCIAAAIFSQTRGAPKNHVGRTLSKVSLRDPLSALASAKQTVAPQKRDEKMSIPMAAM